MRLRPWIPLVASAALLLSCSALSPATQSGVSCSLGTLTAQRTLIEPRPRSFYSVDALNPDVVAYRGRYLMYFSGNSSANVARPRWVTGVAQSATPLGPFRVDPSFRGRYLNGGTALWRGKLWHLVEVTEASSNELSVSTDGRSWRHVAWLPRFRLDGTAVVGADFALTVERGELAAYMFLVHPRPHEGSAFTLGRVLFDGSRWHGFQVVMRRQTSLPFEAKDLGEPFVFARGGRTMMLYVGTATNMVRSIAIAERRNARWIPCDHNPVIGAGAPWARTIAIDPTVLVTRDATYVYYGGATSTGLGSDLGGAIGVARYRVRG